MTFKFSIVLHEKKCYNYPDTMIYRKETDIMKNKKILAFILAAAMTASLAACGTSSDTSSDTSAETAAETSADADSAEETTAAETEAETTAASDYVPTEPVDLDAGITDAMYERAIVNVGDRTRLASVLKRMETEGENLKIGFIGGSITAGSVTSNSDYSYANRVWIHFIEKFGGEHAPNIVNAGIGATDSYIGVHRVERDLFTKAETCPDLVIVEFSVNDTRPLVNKDSYDSLVRRILSQPNNPAVILLFQTQEDGTSLQDVHQEIGFKYDLPMISYKNVVYPEVKAGTLKWSDISPDNIHPNDVGHGLVAQLITRFIDETYDEADSLAGEVTAFDAEPLTNDIYKDAHMLNSEDITADTADNFTLDSIDYNFPNNWVTEGNGTLVFKDIEFRNFGVMFQKRTDGSFGKYDVYIDGEKKAQFDGDFTGGWGNYAETQECMRSSETAKHTVEIKPAPGSEDKGAAILALMIS